jgi:hypothetical protein
MEGSLQLVTFGKWAAHARQAIQKEVMAQLTRHVNSREMTMVREKACKYIPQQNLFVLQCNLQQWQVTIHDAVGEHPCQMLRFRS